MKESSNKHVVIGVDTITIIKILAIAVGAVLALRFLDSVSKPLVLIFVSFFLALALNPAVSWISKKLKSKSRLRATGAAYLIVIAFLVAFTTLVIPPLFKQTADFVKTVPTTLQDLKQDDTAVGRFVQRYDLQKQIDNLSEDVSNRAVNSGDKVLSTVQTIGSTVVSILLVFVLTFMMLSEGPAWLERFWYLHPKEKRKERKEIARKMYRVVTGYVNGQLLISLIGATTTFLALVIASSIYDVTINAVALAGIIGLFALLPLIGTILGSLIVVLACLFVSLPLAITMAIFFVVYQQIENVTIQPIIQSRNNDMTPLMVLLAATIGVAYGGILGALVAIPVAGCIKVLVESRYSRGDTA